MGFALPIVPAPALAESGHAVLRLGRQRRTPSPESRVQIDTTVRSALSLALIALWFKKLLGRAPAVWLPDYFCNSSLGPLRRSGAKLVFYPLNLSLEPDYRWCRERAGRERPDIFVIVHFFGYASNAGEALRFAEELESVLVEDAAHSLSFNARVGAKGAFALRSPHKLVATPHGAVISFDPARLSCRFNPQTIGAATVLWRELLAALPQSRELSVAWLFKRALQRLVGSRLPLVHFDPGLDEIAEVSVPHLRPSNAALQLMAAAEARTAEIFDQRWENFKFWEECVAEWQLAPAWPEMRSRLECPYLFPFTAADPQTLQSGVRELQRAGIPVMSWPDLAPEVLANPQAHVECLGLRSKVYFLPVHQGLNPWVLVKHSGAPKRRGQTCAAVQFTELSRDAWTLKINEAQFPSLLQSSAWAEAKQSEGWSIRRISAELNGEALALLQILTRRRGPLLVQRINRAPLLLRAVGIPELEALYAAIAGLGGVFKASVLSIAPPLEQSAAHLRILQAAGLRPNLGAGRPWISARLDLTQSEELLRAGLEKKWRASLKKAEGERLVVVAASEENRFDDFLTRYQEFVAQRSFVGLSVPLLRELYRAGQAQELLQVLDAELNNQVIGSVCIAQHAGVSTYLAGFAGEAGRRAQVSYLLLWHAILLSKQSGMRYFDLGGTDAVLTPEIAAFKRGLGGREYRLVGEFQRIW